MPARDKFVFALTFIFGMFCGAYLYVVGFSPNFALPEFRSGGDVEAFAVEAERYGGCQMLRGSTCAAFRVTEDGAYRYVPASGPGEAPEVSEGQLSAPLFAALSDAIAASNLPALTTLTEPNTCASYADGIDTLYTVTLESEEFSLDTCGTRFSPDSELGEALQDAWKYLESEHGS